MKSTLISLALASALLPALAFAGNPADRTQTPTPVEQPQLWAAWGGSIEVRWNLDLAGDLGIRISAPAQALPDLTIRGRDEFKVNRNSSIGFHVEGGYFRGFDGGSLQAVGGYVMTLPNGDTINYNDFRLVPSDSDLLRLEFVDADDKSWFYLDRMMYELLDNDRVLSVGTMDMRISRAFAERIGHPEVVDWPIADLAMTTDVQTQGPGAMPLASNPHWHGDTAPNGGRYEVDLFMQSFSMVYSRCQTCTGNEGSGKVVFTPSSTLKNNVNAGFLATTIGGQGDAGISNALWAASVPWYQKFSGNYAPHGNDQHPYLIWNMYRINAEGVIEQIGRSGVKHAWLTTNGNCLDPADHDSHILGRGCTDTYSSGNNDTNSDLGPRSEIVPATGMWGRCGSIYDPGCVGSQTANPNTSWDQRMIVGETQISSTKNPGAGYLYESWYIARDDINPYNSMATLTGNPNWTGSTWAPGGSGFKLGPAIDRWVDPNSPPANAKNTALTTTEGNAKVAVKVRDLGNGNWRYDYAVFNTDFARALTQGNTPNLRVLSNKGFDRFSIPVPTDATITDVWFSDGDLDAANDWQATVSDGQVSWNAPIGNTLDWGTLYSFSITANRPPVTSISELHVAEAGTPASFVVESLAPDAAALPLPSASVSPTALALVADAGTSTSASISITNQGDLGSTLNWSISTAPTSCASPGPVGWLGVEPNSGSTPRGGLTLPIIVTADAGTLAAATYGAKLCIDSDDPDNALIEVPVSLLVNPPPLYSVGGTALEANGIGLALKLNDGDPLAIAGDGPFTFPQGLEDGAAYTVTVVGTRTGRSCSVAYGIGTIAGADVTNVEVDCTVKTIELFSDGFENE